MGLSPEKQEQTPARDRLEQGMTRDEVKNVIMIMSTTYPNWKPDNMSNTVDVWTTLFKDYDVETIQKALVTYIQNDTKGFAPVPGQIIACIETDAGGMSEQEAWDLTYRAISRSNYFADEEFAKLPRECQMAIGTPNNMRQLAMMEIETVQSVEKSHFVRNYRIAVEKLRAEQRQPKYIKDQIEQRKAVGIGAEGL